MIKLLTTVSLKDAENLNNNSELLNSSINNYLNKDLKRVIENYLEETTGHHSGLIIGVQKIYGENANIDNHYDDVGNYLQVTSGTLILNLKVDEDQVVSTTFEELLRYNKKFKESDDFEKELLAEEFQNKIKLGKLDGMNIISFIPYININDCKSFILVNEEWEATDYKLGNVPQIKLAKLNIV